MRNCTSRGPLIWIALEPGNLAPARTPVTSWHEEILDFLGPWFPLSCHGTAAVPRKSQGFLEDVHETFIEPMAGHSASLANTQRHPLGCITHSLTHSFTQQISDLLDAKMCSFSYYNFSEARMACDTDAESTTYYRSSQTETHSPNLAHHLCL